MAEVPSAFPNGLKDTDFFQCRVAGKLVSNRDLADNEQTRAHEKKLTECWDCAWSPDSKYFAWSCGQRIVKVVPTVLLSDNHYINAFDAGLVTIDCRQIVTSVTFGNCAATAAKLSTCPSLLSTGYRAFHWEKHELVLVVGLRNGRIRIYDITTGRVLLELIDHDDAVAKLDFSPDDSLLMVSASYDGTLKCWDLTDDGNMTQTLQVARYTKQPSMKLRMNHAVWAADARRVAAVGTCKLVFIFDIPSKKCVKTLTGHQDSVKVCDFSPDGVLLASCSADTVTIVWNSHTGQPIVKLGHQFPPPSLWFPKDTDTQLKSCRFSRDGLQLVTVADDDFVRLWDLSEPFIPSSIYKLADPTSLSFKPDGAQVSVGTGSGSVTMLETQQKVLPLSHICRLKVNSLLQQPQQTITSLPLPLDVIEFLEYHYFKL